MSESHHKLLVKATYAPEVHVRGQREQVGDPAGVHLRQYITHVSLRCTAAQLIAYQAHMIKSTLMLMKAQQDANIQHIM